MAETDPKILAMVERALKKNPKISNADLRERATKISKAVGAMSARQFHAKYPLQVKRKLGQAERGSRPASPKTVTRKKRKTTRKTVDRSAAPQPEGKASRMIAADFSTRKKALSSAIDRAFSRAMQSNDLRRINSVLDSLDASLKQFQKK